MFALSLFARRKALLLLIVLMLPGLASATRINDSDIGTPVSASDPREPKGFTSAQGWTVHWASDCQAAHLRLAMWIERCDEGEIRFLNRRKLDVLNRNMRSAANYLPQPYDGGAMRYTREGQLALVELYFKLTEWDALLTQLSAQYGEPTVTTDGRHWQVGQVSLQLSERSPMARHGQLRSYYLPLRDQLPAQD